MRLAYAFLFSAACMDHGTTPTILTADLNVAVSLSTGIKGFDVPTYFVKLSSDSECITVDDSVHATFRGEPMTLVFKGGINGEDTCTPAIYSIKATEAGTADDRVTIADRTTTVEATFASGLLDTRDATTSSTESLLIWRLDPGTSISFTWSADLAAGTVPSLCFEIPGTTPPPGSEGVPPKPAQPWLSCPTGIVTGRDITFQLPNPFDVTGTGVAVVNGDHASGTALECTAGGSLGCTFDLSYAVRSGAHAMPQ